VTIDQAKVGAKARASRAHRREPAKGRSEFIFAVRISTSFPPTINRISTRSLPGPGSGVTWAVSAWGLQCCSALNGVEGH
jgi:hypothetical protein